jgi:hypothetical protein
VRRGDWRRNQRNAERGDRMMREGIARIYAEHNAKLASAQSIPALAAE